MIQAILDIIAPDDCINCSLEGAILCEWCRLDQDYVPSRCYKCHAQSQNFATCLSCKKSTNLKRVIICQEYKNLAKDLIIALKFDCKRQAALPIARMMNERIPLFELDYITFVPTAYQRARQRGFDHAKLIATNLAKLRSMRCVPLLLRTNNSHQVGSSKKQRIAQATNTYKVRNNNELDCKKILLIDDVITTGATLQAATKALQEAGANKIYIATFAYSK